MTATARPTNRTVPRRRPARTLLAAAGGLLALVSMTVPAAAQTSIDYDGGTDFSHYKTYAWGQNTSSGNPAADAHIIEWIEAQLTAAGWTKVDKTDEADVVIAEHATVTNDVSVDTFYTGWGTGWGWTGFGPGAGTSTIISQHLRSGSLVVDMFDSKTKKLIWRGTAEGALSTKPEENFPKVQRIIQRLFKKFPPTPAPPAPAAQPTTEKPPHKHGG